MTTPDDPGTDPLARNLDADDPLDDLDDQAAGQPELVADDLDDDDGTDAEDGAP